MRYDSRQLAHVWAQQSERRGASNGALTFDGPALYSYREPIGRFVEHRGRRVVLLSSRRFSITTSKHQSFAANAVPRGLPVFRVPDLSSHPDHRANLRALTDAAGTAHLKIARAKANRDWRVTEAAQAFEAAKDYAAFFGLTFKAATPNDLAAEVEAAAKREAKRLKKEAADRRKANAAAFEEWQAGVHHYCPPAYAVDANGSVYMRISPDGQNLETSRGASVPLAHALRVFQFIRKVRETGEGFKANGRVIRVGHFTVSEITPAGDMVAGCHRFTWERIAEVAAIAGALTLPPSDAAVELRNSAPAA